MQFSPRLRDLLDQKLHKVKGLDLDYPEVLKFTGTINLEKIISYWEEILHVVGSIKTGC